MTEYAIGQKEKEGAASLKRETVHKGRLFSVQRDTLSFEGEPDHSWDIVVHPGAVAIIPITEKGNLLLARQWRRAAEKILFELPAGTLDDGEDPLDCAKREIQEEVNVKAEQWTPLGGFYTAPGFCTEYIHLYVAEELSESSLPGDVHEAIDIEEVSLDKALSMIAKGEIIDVKTIAGILRYKEELR